MNLFIFSLLSISNLQATRPTLAIDYLPRTRIIWTAALKVAFSDAIENLTLAAKPVAILEYMKNKHSEGNPDIEKLTPKQVASYLQKFRLREKQKNPDSEWGGKNTLPMTHNFNLSTKRFTNTNIGSKKESGNELNEKNQKAEVANLDDNGIGENQVEQEALKSFFELLFSPDN